MAVGGKILQIQRQMHAAQQAAEDRRRRELADHELQRRTYNNTARGVILGCLALPVLLFLAVLVIAPFR